MTAWCELNMSIQYDQTVDWEFGEEGSCKFSITGSCSSLVGGQTGGEVVCRQSSLLLLLNGPWWLCWHQICQQQLKYQYFPAERENFREMVQWVFLFTGRTGEQSWVWRNQAGRCKYCDLTPPSSQGDTTPHHPHHTSPTPSARE